MPEQESEATMETSFQELPDAPPRRRIRFSLSGKIGIFLVLFWVLMIFIGPSISPYNEADFLDESLFIVPGGDEYPDTDYQPPSKVALLGTDYLGRDTLSRILYGARTTIGISFAATLIAYLLGVTLGIAAAVGSEWLDMCLSRFNDAFLSIPTIMMGLVVIAAVGSTIPILVIMTGFIYATSVFRVARSLGQDVMVSDFVEAAKVRGEGLWWIITREILPNIVMPLATDFGLRFVWIILFISALSFLGLGVQPPMSDWGSMVKENLGGLPYGSIAPLMPSLAIASLTISINLIVDDISAHSGGKLSNKMI
ncbi:MAG: ABC transporter permease [SAR324 cluster bacterium]|jgi:peptide/nickel transport system permease protein|nr:ABC transporter permease [SAR324 cluster bacterium]MEE1576689.1 ABC transporter permease [Deltaproteobacteria bacterium]MDP6245378.1 ABC transporter permease [SAR324 cluster bacterium]MDP6464640.1 ABC transporter permease [SAR324 cluster bacterium]MDP6638358.1 ABC transporter permease [SAR324 cluster bacterium]|tara:strand:- start:1499 stop:2431 length:933 start_codon:yes stop_codon:yes gene_type:complete